MIKWKFTSLFLFIFLILQILLIKPCYSKNLGIWGTVFPIIEKDIKEFIYEHLNQMQQNGELEKMKQKFISNVKSHILRPSPVAGLTTTEHPKTFYYDPTYVVDKTITDYQGNVIAQAGTTINPLNMVKLRGVMFFLDADDSKQIKWALQEAKKHEYVRYILVKSDIKIAGKLLNDRIYFDQYGSITKQLGIKHIPTMVKQHGKKLKIQEIGLLIRSESEGK